jgi:5-methylcytosine-specific restriction endonuclease McrA
MPRKISRKGLIKKLDKLFSLYIRTRYAMDGMVRCVTCNTIKYTSEIDAGHFVSRRHYSTRWHPTNVQTQCKKCNNWGSGESYLFGKYLDKTHGVGTADELIKLSREITKFTDQDLKDMIKLYEN